MQVSNIAKAVMKRVSSYGMCMLILAVLTISLTSLEDKKKKIRLSEMNRGYFSNQTNQVICNKIE